MGGAKMECILILIDIKCWCQDFHIWEMCIEIRETVTTTKFREHNQRDQKDKEKFIK